MSWKKMNKLKKALDNLDGAIELIHLFAGNLAVTEDYKMDFFADEYGWEKINIDASEISSDLLKLVVTARDKYLELCRMIEDVSNELECKED